MLLLAANNEKKRKQAKQRKSEGGRCNNCQKHLCWVWIVLPNEEGRSTRGLTSQELRAQAEEDDEVKDEIGKLITHQCGNSNFGCLSDRCCCKCGKFRMQAEDQQAQARTGVLVGGAMMTRRGVGRGRPVLGAVVIANSVQRERNNRQRAEERRRILVSPYKRGKINPRDFCIPIDVSGAISIHDKKEKKEKVVVHTTTTVQVPVPVLVQQQATPLIYGTPPSQMEPRYTTVIGVPWDNPVPVQPMMQQMQPQQVMVNQQGQQYVLDQLGQPIFLQQQPMQQTNPFQVYNPQFAQQQMYPPQGQVPQQAQYLPQPMQQQQVQPQMVYAQQPIQQQFQSIPQQGTYPVQVQTQQGQ